jgi:transcriptional regulator of aromatic amino acid metabolism
MEISTKLYVPSSRAAGPVIWGALLEDCALAQAARANLLLVHVDADLQDFVESLLLDRREPMPIWRPGQPLVLPPHARRMMILQDVGAMSLEDQHRLLAWLEGPGKRTQIVSTSPVSLVQRLEAGTFLDTLYYRLNVVYVDVAARMES